MAKIYINPGHSDKDPGAVGYEVERELAVKVSNYQREHLLANYDCQVRTNPGSMSSLAAIAADANAWGADLFVSNHFNAGGGDGWEGLVYASNRVALGRVFEKYVKAAGQNSRGVKLRPELAVLRLTKMPAILTEGAFVDNKKDIADWNDDAELKRLGIAYAEATAEVLGLKRKATAPTAAERLAALGVIDSPDYWETAQHRLAYLPELLEALADAAGSRLVASTETAQVAIQRLVDCHVIKSPGYWLENHGKVQHLDALLVKAANRIGSQATQEAPKWYRVRKSWDDADSQLGAFLQLAHAKLACAAGYTVFDWTGKAVYANKPKKSIDQVAREVIAGKWGNGSERRERLKAEGYDPDAVQLRVNQLL